jgi:zinc protease
MMREIRSNRGLAYSVYSHFIVGRHLPELFVAGSETKSETTAEVLSLMLQQMQLLRDEPVSAGELELAKQSLINSFVFAFNDTHSIVSRRLRLDYFAYQPDYLETYRQQVAAVSIADVQRVAQKYLHPDQLQVVLVGQSKYFSEAVAAFGLPVEAVNLEAD